MTPDDIAGDMDFDGDLDLDDVDPFLLALSAPDDYYDMFGGKDFVHGDLSEDGDLDLDDVIPFVDALVAGSGSGSSGAASHESIVYRVPEPPFMTLLLIGVTSILLAPNRRRTLQRMRPRSFTRERWSA